MKILVTGGAGFIGSHLCKRLVDEGNEVICVDNFYTGRKKNIEKLLESDKFSVMEHDIINPLEITGLDRIYNLACPASPPAYQKDPVFTWKTSVIGVMNMLDLARKNNNCRVLQTSTSEVYGDPLEHPQKESYWGNVNPIGIRSCYDEGKRASETLIVDYFRKFDLPVRIIRIFNTYGSNMDPNDGRVVSNFIVQALSNQDITIYGDGSQTRSFQYVDDLIDGMLKMMENNLGFIGPVNIGNPGEFTIKELAEIVLKMILESKSKIVFKDIPKDDPKIRKPDITLAKEKLSWEPLISLEKGLVQTIAYFRSEVE
ncbi:MAG: NAD-dependent epimerase/dehydratase [Candidatus Collierbacteria bacterium GW2011_GWE2_42_48]|uniref:UDP-glucuronate decarboxylase n=1 Tax=Candidatus Collierbacteria bacterium GW2011_GWA2_42_17 TaxID=1618378 RepID=A0A0G1C0Z4_9BACT|nr:MAG: NAD-dependent epimerase/dehydratase [Candidatus Collierbacteria bacterium GW2011_GWB2_42_12]KKS43323.1 MAG: NAD-dependent epimerase/dehydratase [Candidatus Collierbacteria bacterium GW2011_GWA2_42_17]KKS61535.1 MAG: NAD-dependent epimerase/dehydratase [Candidatus Collierbacteria bacterium GW2011_GWE2_42_48]KKS61723.1 MAG: NAD-dependent epimerase/dehydratase [Candidatus Collierbacteria bacterium GW2011_GWD2_42_50]KKS62262.1 MAG: NAD-dependent epimerase/dehydratase [Candidatus Collierbact